MAENSKIAWTDHTFNPWIGCTKVSDGCKFCYAEAQNKRYGYVDEWGPQGTRKRTSAAYWKKPLKWNDDIWIECKKCGYRGPHKFGKPGLTLCDQCQSHPIDIARQRVFCASLADVFEDNPQVEEWRIDLWNLIEQTPNLDWLLLTKRPESIADRIGCKTGWPVSNSNVWIGTTVENQKAAEERIPQLLKVPAKVKFLSVEPMLGNLDLINLSVDWGLMSGGIDWIICGGESGPGCRPMFLGLARHLAAECEVAGVPFFMKQLGGHPDKRDKLSDFPEDLRIREFPVVEAR